jgi:hypothetical protein
MVRTTIDAPDEVLDQLRRLAELRGTSIDVVIREALEEKAARCRQLPKSLGMGDSGFTDTARRIGEEGLPPQS